MTNHKVGTRLYRTEGRFGGSQRHECTVIGHIFGGYTLLFTDSGKTHDWSEEGVHERMAPMKPRVQLPEDLFTI
jgi:hypothetical protein